MQVVVKKLSLFGAITAFINVSMQDLCFRDFYLL